MGKLTKHKRDLIAKLRKEGYTQQETADAAGVHVRTARAHDPLSKSGRSKKPSLQNEFAVLKEDIRQCLEYVRFIEANADIGNCCPDCGTDLAAIPSESAHICKKCGYKLLVPLSWSHSVLSDEEITETEQERARSVYKNKGRL